MIARLGADFDSEVANDLGISTSAVTRRRSVERRRAVLNMQDVAGLGYRKLPRELAGARYIKAYRAEKRIADIARAHKVTHSSVTKAIQRYVRRSGVRRVIRRRGPQA